MSLSPRSPPPRTSPSSTRTSSSSKVAGKSANAIAQSRHREKKKSYVTSLEQTAASLRAENEHLRSELEQLKLQQLKPRRHPTSSPFSRTGAASSPSISKELRREKEKEEEIHRLKALIFEMGAPFPPSSSSSSSSPSTTSSTALPIHMDRSSRVLHREKSALPASSVPYSRLASPPQPWDLHPFPTAAVPFVGGSTVVFATPTSVPPFVSSHLLHSYQCQAEPQSSGLGSFDGAELGWSGGGAEGVGGGLGLSSRPFGLETEEEAGETARPVPSFLNFDGAAFASSPASDGSYPDGRSSTSEASYHFFDPHSGSHHHPIFSPSSSPELDTSRHNLCPWPASSEPSRAIAEGSYNESTSSSFSPSFYLPLS